MTVSRILAILLATAMAAWVMPAAGAGAAAAAPLVAQAEEPVETPGGETGESGSEQPPADGTETPTEDPPDDSTGGSPGRARSPAADPDYTPPTVETDLSKLPFPVRRMRELLVEAARSGDIERLRPFVGEGDDVTLFSFGGIGGDPIEFLRSSSGDPEGHEILAILLEVLEAGYVHVEPGTENELFIWPYFYGVQLDKLTPPQRVELFKLLTFGDYEDMLSFGAYVFYRAGITPAGRWRFFVAGD